MGRRRGRKSEFVSVSYTHLDVYKRQGWYYSEWLKNLSDNMSMPNVEIGKKIVEDYINGPDSSLFDSRCV